MSLFLQCSINLCVFILYYKSYLPSINGRVIPQVIKKFLTANQKFWTKLQFQNRCNQFSLVSTQKVLNSVSLNTTIDHIIDSCLFNFKLKKYAKFGRRFSLALNQYFQDENVFKMDFFFIFPAPFLKSKLNKNSILFFNRNYLEFQQTCQIFWKYYQLLMYIGFLTSLNPKQCKQYLVYMYDTCIWPWSPKSNYSRPHPPNATLLIIRTDFSCTEKGKLYY